MPRWRRWTDDDGNASLEFITAGMILLLPLVYLVLVVAAVQAGSLAVEGAARQAVRVFVQATHGRMRRRRVRRGPSSSGSRTTGSRRRMRPCRSAASRSRQPA